MKNFVRMLGLLCLTALIFSFNFFSDTIEGRTAQAATAESGSEEIKDIYSWGVIKSVTPTGSVSGVTPTGGN